MQFGRPDLWFVLIAPILGYVLCTLKMKRKEKLLNKLIDTDIQQKVIKDFEQGKSQERNHRVYLLISLLSLALSILRPQWGYEWVERARAGIDIAIAVDVSQSMLANDIKPSRLERAKREVLDLLPRLGGDRVTLISFAGTAYIEMPLTQDYAAFKSVLTSLTPQILPIQGTNVELAIEKSVRALDQHQSKDSESPPARSRALLLITDGEGFEGDLNRASALAKERKVIPFILGVGTEAGAPIPTQKGYKRDSKGSVIITRLSNDSLKTLAEETGGIFVTSIAGDKDTIALYEQGMKRMLEDAAQGQTRAKVYNELFQIPLLFGLLILLRMWPVKLSSLKPQAWLKSFGRATSKEKMLACFLLIAVPAESHAEVFNEIKGFQASKHFKEGQFEKAEEEFANALTTAENDARLAMGHGAALYRLKKFPEAYTAFLLASENSILKQDIAKALFNAGNSLVQMGKLKESLSLYEKALSHSPEDEDIKSNIEYVKKLLKEQEEEKQDQSKSKDESDRKGEKHSGEGESGENTDSSEQESSDSNSSSNQQQNSSSSQSQSSSSDSESEKEKSDAESHGSSSSSENSGDEEESESKGQSQSSSSSSQSSSESGASSSDSSDNSGENDGQNQTQDANELSDFDKSQLQSIKESSKARLNYRFRQGMKDLQRQQIPTPEKDW